MSSRHPFAPGAIEHHRRQFGTPTQRRELKRWLLVLALLASMALTLGTAAGYVAGS